MQQFQVRHAGMKPEMCRPMSTRSQDMSAHLREHRPDVESLWPSSNVLHMFLKRQAMILT